MPKEIKGEPIRVPSSNGEEESVGVLESYQSAGGWVVRATLANGDTHERYVETGMAIGLRVALAVRGARGAARHRADMIFGTSNPFDLT